MFCSAHDQTYVYNRDLKDNGGFTLVELLVVTTILGVLVTISFLVFGNAQKSSRDTRRKADIKAITIALEQYKLENSRYPGPTSSTGRAGWGESDLNPTNFIQNMNSYFASGSLPVDPINNETYRYAYYRYPPGTSGCDNSYFYVLGIREFENSTDLNGWRCSGRDWGGEFDYVVGSYE